MEYYVRLIDLPVAVKSFVIEKEDVKTVVLNSRLSREQNVISCRHEEKHITGNDYEKEDVQVIETQAHGKGDE